MTKVLAELVLEVAKTGENKKLETEKSQQFHRDFEAKISAEAEELRAAKRRAYEEMKNIAVR